MGIDPTWKDFGRNANAFAIWMGSSLIDAIFLAGWAILQWGVNRITAYFPLRGIDKWVYITFQVILAASTLVPVICYIGADMHRIIMQAREVIVRQRSSTDGN